MESCIVYCSSISCSVVVLCIPVSVTAWGQYLCSTTSHQLVVSFYRLNFCGHPPSVLPARWRGTHYLDICMIPFSPPLKTDAYLRHFFSECKCKHRTEGCSSDDVLYELTFYLLIVVCYCVLAESDCQLRLQATGDWRTWAEARRHYFSSRQERSKLVDGWDSSWQPDFPRSFPQDLCLSVYRLNAACQRRTCSTQSALSVNIFGHVCVICWPLIYGNIGLLRIVLFWKSSCNHGVHHAWIFAHDLIGFAAFDFV